MSSLKRDPDGGRWREAENLEEHASPGAAKGGDASSYAAFGGYGPFDDFSDQAVEGPGDAEGGNYATYSSRLQTLPPWQPPSPAWRTICSETDLSRVQSLTQSLLDEDSNNDIPVEKLQDILEDTERLRESSKHPGQVSLPREGHDGLTGSVSPISSPTRYRGEPAAPRRARFTLTDADGALPADSPAALPSIPSIPRIPKRDSLAYRVKQLARDRELASLWDKVAVLAPEDVRRIVQEVADASDVGGIGFGEWQTLCAQLTSRCPPLKSHLTAGVFARLPMPEPAFLRMAKADGTTASAEEAELERPVRFGLPARLPETVFPVEVVQDCICKILEGLHDYVLISQHYADIQGYITPEVLEEFLFEKVSACPFYDKVTPSFMPYFLYGVSKAFFYFLDPVHCSRIRVRDLVRSPFLRQLLSDPADPPQPGIGELSGPLGRVFPTWFCLPAQSDMYSAYLQVDSGGEGLISQEDLASLPGLSLTNSFMRQLFMSVQTFGGRLDYRGYIDLLLAISFPRNTACARYLFPILDIRNCGHLSRGDILYYLRDIIPAVTRCCGEGVQLNVDDFVDEIYDVVKPLDGETITLQDLRRTRSAEILMAYLVDPAFLLDKEMAAQAGVVVGKARAWEP